MTLVPREMKLMFKHSLNSSKIPSCTCHTGKYNTEIYHKPSRWSSIKKIDQTLRGKGGGWFLYYLFGHNTTYSRWEEGGNGRGCNTPFADEASNRDLPSCSIQLQIILCSLNTTNHHHTNVDVQRTIQININALIFTGT